MLNDQELAVLQQIASALDSIADTLSTLNEGQRDLCDAVERLNYGDTITNQFDTLLRIVGALRP